MLFYLYNYRLSNVCSASGAPTSQIDLCWTANQACWRVALAPKGVTS